MKVLVACEYSGTTRDAFLKLGHDAMSCDLLPTESEGPHYQGNVLDILYDGWDLLIAHPPCTYLSYAATSSWNNPGRAELREQALEFFILFINAPIEKICVENPVGYPNTVYRKPDQIIHPYYFGEPEMKRTCLWLKNLPLLTYDIANKKNKPEPYYVDSNGKNRHFTDATRGGKTRSKSFKSIANAMASQWG
jgi:hypothetical protein